MEIVTAFPRPVRCIDNLWIPMLDGRCFREPSEGRKKHAT